MDSVVCTRHGAPCMLKTGSKPGPNFGKSFYICSVLRDKCDFVQAAPKAPTSNCLKHPENVADLQYVAIGKVSGEKRHYYRCAQGVQTGQNWCGFAVIGTVPKVVPLTDIKNCDRSSDNSLSSVSVKQSAALVEGLLHGKSSENRDSGVSKISSQEDCETRKLVTVDLTKDNSSAQPSSRGEAKSSKSITVNLSSDNSRHLGGVKIFSKATSSESGLRGENSCNKVTTLSGEEIHTPTDVVHVDLTTADSLEHQSVDRLLSDNIAKISLADGGTSSQRTDATAGVSHSTSIQIMPGETFQTSSGKLASGEPASSSTSQGHVSLSAGDSHVSDPITAEYIAMREKTLKQLKQKKMIISTINLRGLPDKGERLRQQVEDLEMQLSALDKKLAGGSRGSGGATAKHGQPPPPPPPPPPPVFSQGHRQPQVYTVFPTTKTGAGASAKPKTMHVPHQHGKTSQGTKQTTLSFTAKSQGPRDKHAQGKNGIVILKQAEPIPDHVLKQMYSSNPQSKTLYGGRMTADRLKEVGTVTRDAIEDLHKQLERRPAETTELDDPKGLNVPLMTHQRQALAWLIWREQQRPSGGILADDMGLGKTLTMISLIMKQRELNQDPHESGKSGEGKGSGDWLSKDKQLEKLDKNIVKSRATLVICPASLIHQWNNEIENRCKEGILTNVLLYHGPQREPNVFKLADNDVVLTTYNIVSKEVGEDADAKEAEKPVGQQDFFKKTKGKGMPNLSRIAWARVVLDEAHNIKNHKCKTSIAVCRLRAWCRWALTGTPIQNDLIDMYSLLRFLRCSPFDEFQVWKRQVAMNVGTGKARLNTLVKSFLLRRTKDQTGKNGKPLVPLPKKSVITHDLKLSKDEKSVYDKVFSESRSKFQEYLSRHAEKKGENFDFMPDKGSSGTGERNPFVGHGATGKASGTAGVSKATGATHILVSLLRLRQCCGHLSLLRDAIEEEVLETEGIELSLEEQMRGLMLKDDDGPKKSKSSKSKSHDKYDISNPSTKIKAVMDEILELQKKSSKDKPQKSVVVSQWTKMLEIAAHHIEKVGIRCCVIQGNIPPHKRMETVQEFNTNPKGPEVMLLSLKAGGVGLNLIGGNNLFLLDQHWNPALEQQACDRIYRVGQKKDVFIHRFLCQDTIEEKIAELHRRKMDLANDILSGSTGSKSKLTLADLRLLFGV